MMKYYVAFGLLFTQGRDWLYIEDTSPCFRERINYRFCLIIAMCVEGPIWFYIMGFSTLTKTVSFSYKTIPL